MGIAEWFDELFKKKYNLVNCLCDIVNHLLENYIIYFIFIHFLGMSICYFSAI